MRSLRILWTRNTKQDVDYHRRASLIFATATRTSHPIGFSLINGAGWVLIDETGERLERWSVNFLSRSNFQACPDWFYPCHFHEDGERGTENNLSSIAIFFSEVDGKKEKEGVREKPHQPRGEEREREHARYTITIESRRYLLLHAAHRQLSVLIGNQFKHNSSYWFL